VITARWDDGGVTAALLAPASASRAATSSSGPTGLTGLSGWVADVLADLGAPGVGLLTLLETVFPPIPSEVVLPLAGFLAQQGRAGLAAVLLAATLGSLLGALVLYEVARRIGQQRSTALLARLPLVDAEDVEAATAWFVRHGRSAVLLGRLVPGVRSLISLPAGAAGMPLAPFVVLTAAGSLLWNALLVGAGYALGTQWERVQPYAQVLDRVVLAAAAAAVAWLVVRRVRKRRA
jgi:membrane protein DedA with SNARE-associated domain